MGKLKLLVSLSVFKFIFRIGIAGSSIQVR